MPALRDRPDDIPSLAQSFVLEAASRLKRRISKLSPAAAKQLLRYPWPGNVRELENAMERGVALATGDRVELEDLPAEVQAAVSQVRHGVQTLGEVEQQHILAVLDLNGGNQNDAAKQLGISSATLYRRLKDYGRVRTRARSEGVADSAAPQQLHVHPTQHAFESRP
jgi:DNA-binding NtrC family response regulator